MQHSALCPSWLRRGLQDLEGRCRCTCTGNCTLRIQGVGGSHILGPEFSIAALAARPEHLRSLATRAAVHRASTSHARPDILCQQAPAACHPLQQVQPGLCSQAPVCQAQLRTHGGRQLPCGRGAAGEWCCGGWRSTSSCATKGICDTMATDFCRATAIILQPMMIWLMPPFLC